MQGKILLNSDANTQQIEKEEKDKFLLNLLSSMGVPIEGIDNTFDISARMKLRNILVNYGIQVIDEADGEMRVYVEKELVGEWNKSTYKLKRDLQELDRKKQLYIEMTINFWTIFDKEIE